MGKIVNLRALKRREIIFNELTNAENFSAFSLIPYDCIVYQADFEVSRDTIDYIRTFILKSKTYLRTR